MLERDGVSFVKRPVGVQTHDPLLEYVQLLMRIDKRIREEAGKNNQEDVRE